MDQQKDKSRDRASHCDADPLCLLLLFVSVRLLLLIVLLLLLELGRNDVCLLDDVLAVACRSDGSFARLRLRRRSLHEIESQSKPAVSLGYS